ncbi:hypothetical protein [Kitasatospora griseola]
MADRVGDRRGGRAQHLHQCAAFAAHQNIPLPLPLPLLSDAALRLTTFRAGGAERLKRLPLLIDATRTVRSVLHPVPDPGGSVQDALALIDVVGSGS